MQNAIMQSKLEFEQQKKNFVIKTSTEVSQGKKKKGKTMGLDEFLESNKETEQKNKGNNFALFGFVFLFVSIDCLKLIINDQDKCFFLFLFT